MKKLILRPRARLGLRVRRVKAGNVSVHVQGEHGGSRQRPKGEIRPAAAADVVVAGEAHVSLTHEEAH